MEFNEGLEGLFVKAADELIAEVRKMPGGELFAKAQEILLSDDDEYYVCKPYIATTQNQRYLLEVVPKHAKRVCVVLGAGDTIFQLASKGIKDIVAVEINDLQTVIFKLRKAALFTLTNTEFENFLLDLESKDFLSEEILEKVKRGFMEDEEKEMNFWDVFLELNLKEEIVEYFIKGGLEHADLYKRRYALPYLKRSGVYDLASKNLKESNLRIEVEDALEFFNKTTEMFDFIDITNILMFIYQIKCNNDQEKFEKVIKVLERIYKKNLKPGGTMVLDYMFSISPKELETSKSKIKDGSSIARKTEELYKNVYNALKKTFNTLETLQVTACCTPIPLRGDIDTVIYVRK